MILGVTPARGGSLGVPRKNLRPVLGHPLLAWTIEAARRARRLDRYIVSTEDEEIGAVARAYGAEMLPRPAHLTRHETTTLEVLHHVVAEIPCETVVLLQATSPIRDHNLIDDCVDLFMSRRADSLATGCYMTKVAYGEYPNMRRQDLPAFFWDDGNVYVIRADLIRRGDRYGTRIERVVVDREQNLDIDDEFDLWLAEQVLARRIQAGIQQRPTRRGED